ncbi:MAG TPA: hypothetical protein VEL28_01730 [Candidatus Binatia bacterium]|nr:hypothetical protein [Candidatus Binatia bacterium]
MKHRALGIACVAIVWSEAAHAQCDFDIGALTTSFSSSLVRSYAACPSDTHPITNVETVGDVDACEPVTPTEDEFGDSTHYSFAAASSRCTVKLNATRVTNCSTYGAPWFQTPGLTPGPCQALRVRLDCRGIVQDDDATLITAISDAGWRLDTVFRFTRNDPVNGDMTVIDFPLSFDADIPLPGRLRIDQSANSVMRVLTNAAEAKFPPCSSVQLVEMRLRDPASRIFAEIGLSTR